MKQNEIAIDVEAVQNSAALLQISTRSADYIVDPLFLWTEIAILNPVMLDANIVKVLHGSENDIKWLRWNLNLTIVNLFDTQAAQWELGLSQKSESLKDTIQTYCGVELNKSINHQKWKRRPLTTEQFQYARQDTHYLLEVYDVLRAKFSEEMRELYDIRCAHFLHGMTADNRTSEGEIQQRQVQRWCADAREAVAPSPEIKKFYSL